MVEEVLPLSWAWNSLLLEVEKRVIVQCHEREARDTLNFGCGNVPSFVLPTSPWRGNLKLISKCGHRYDQSFVNSDL